MPKASQQSPSHSGSPTERGRNKPKGVVPKFSTESKTCSTITTIKRLTTIGQPWRRWSRCRLGLADCSFIGAWPPAAAASDTGPAAAALDGALPAGVEGLALVGGQPRREAPVGAPVTGDVRGVPPEADGEACQVGSAERGSLQDGGAHHVAAEDVRLELQEQVVRGRAAVHPQLGERDAGLVLDGGDDV